MPLSLPSDNITVTKGVDEEALTMLQSAVGLLSLEAFRRMTRYPQPAVFMCAFRIAERDGKICIDSQPLFGLGADMEAALLGMDLAAGVAAADVELTEILKR